LYKIKSICENIEIHISANLGSRILSTVGKTTENHGIFLPNYPYIENTKRIAI